MKRIVKKSIMKTKKKAIKLAIKINFYLVMLIIAYELLQIIILKGSLFKIESFLVFLFYLNCFVVVMKIFEK